MLEHGEENKFSLCPTKFRFQTSRTKKMFTLAINIILSRNSMCMKEKVNDEFCVQMLEMLLK